MKRAVALLVLCCCCLSAMADGLSEDLAALKKDREKKVKIGGVKDDTIRNEADEKIESLKFYTNQYEDDDLTYRVRVTIELTDKEKNIYYAQLQRGQGSLPDDYTGEDTWEFQVPHGTLDKPKMSAYAIEYGFFKDGQFVPVVAEFDDVDSAEEITERATAGRADMQITEHTYKYRDQDDEIQTSMSNHAELK